MQYHDVVVVGGGLAGLRAALEVNMHNLRVAILSKVYPIRSHSVAAQGGINAPLGNHPRGAHDSWERHAFDTVKGSDYLADQDAAVRMAKDAAERIIEMEHWGCPFSRTPNGKIAQRPFGGAGFPRTCFAADKTGHMLIHTLFEQIVKYEQAAERGELKIYNEWLVTSLVIEGGVCRGVIALELATGKLEAFKADAVLFATGGCGRLYTNSTNAMINTGMGMAVPFWAGIPLKDMEFIQFHPTTLYGSNILMTEGCRGEGGYLTNKRNERFLANYPDSRKGMEVAPRDIVSRNITTEILEGRAFENAYVNLDLRHLGEERIAARLPAIREICRKFLGIDPVHEPIPVQPGQHYTMGGIDVNSDGASPAKGFYAAGEASCVSVHGANRLGGNSLLETIVFGKIAGEHMSNYVFGKTDLGAGDKTLEDALAQEEKKLKALMNSDGGENPSNLKEEMQRMMTDKVGIFRTKESLSDAQRKIRELRDRYKKVRLRYTGGPYNYDLASTIELKGSIDVAETVIVGALAREESRGSQFRRDFPARNDEKFLQHTLAYFTPEGPRLDYKDVTLGYWEPKERKY
ncbi:MAG: FAD-binding protein [Candidatus Abyssobacteria bacterium SURF_5]|uniref:succinate dehydrogenase n=1 Tax=Abyssobacteria bacterium (strain SURF_5) TaxID=2093360 RepID=A0A3A4NQ91_ABYX5|nr:MAG: FAD-binding protein [Candidatus Abyssubacteria bacterium SURF_5]